jgi:hypothetical protein
MDASSEMKNHAIVSKPWFRVAVISLVLAAVLLATPSFNSPASAYPAESTTSTPTSTPTPTGTPTPTATPYWTESGGVDYAPNGMPDFDQQQDAWIFPGTQTWTYCGPVAVANCLWWLDSKMERQPVPPPTMNDHYPLVQSYPPCAWDDHDPRNLPPLVQDLALLMDTDGQRSGMPHLGTYVWDIEAAINEYLARQGLADFYEVTMVHHPTFEWVVDEVEQNSAVILLLSFYLWDDEHGQWIGQGGHFVTMAGVDSHNRLVFFSDPFYDRAEAGWPGRVLPPGPHDHPSEPPDTTHNDAQYLSHDMYQVVDSERPGGNWGPADYKDANAVGVFSGQNLPGSFPQELELTSGGYEGGPYQTEVRYAIAISSVVRIVYLPVILKSQAQRAPMPNGTSILRRIALS